MREFAFEMRLCACLESEGHLVARQLGAGASGGAGGARVVDAVIVEPGPSFDQRTRITPETIPRRVLESDLGPGRARREGSVLDRDSEYERAAFDRAVEQGFLERERRGGQQYLRQAVRYPDYWFDGIVGIENKPDLDRPGDLALQLRKDVSLGLFDRVVLATASHVTGAHLNRLPDAVGVWRFFPERDDYEVVREPQPLAVDEPGLAVLDRRAGRTEVRPVDAAAKERYRRRIAERAYGKGWRVPFPDCPHVEERAVAGVGGLPFCSRKGRIAHPSEACEAADGERASGAETVAGGSGTVADGSGTVDGSADDTGDADEATDGAGDGVDDSGVDLDARRDATSPWVRDPPGVRSRQSGLDRFR